MIITRILYIKIIFTLIISFSYISLKSQSDGVSPQLWNNGYVLWNVSERFDFRGALSYNVLLNKTVPWNEISATAAGAWKFHRFMDASLGIYMARSLESSELKSFEYRPFIGFRLFTDNKRRWLISNRSRFEIRTFVYSDESNDFTFRFRNLTYASISLNKREMTMFNNLFVFAYFEVFYNFEKEVQERFFDLFKYKIGLGYRLDKNWRFDLGFVNQDSRNTIEIPSQLPSDVITRYVIEWSIAYTIPSKHREQNK